MQANPDDDCTGAYDCAASSHIDGCYVNDRGGAVNGGDPPGIVDPRTEFIRQLGELVREHDDVFLVHVFFDDGSHGALTYIGDDLAWALAPGHWGTERG